MSECEVEIPNDLSETYGDTLDQGFEDCSDCPNRLCQQVVVVRNTNSKHDEIQYVCGWCLSTQLWSRDWQIKRVYYGATKSSIDVGGNRRIFIISKGSVEKDGVTLYKYDTKTERISPEANQKWNKCV